MLTPARRGQLVADTNSAAIEDTNLAAIEDTNLATIHAKCVIARSKELATACRPCSKCVQRIRRAAACNPHVYPVYHTQHCTLV
ncbi:hypothetical protein FS749_003631 [Ceratobasidium sp. UAMH 11750]|nr:hypothetical protein FS749_003631 [Ceratobasidium sp. UAMH 11750]